MTSWSVPAWFCRLEIRLRFQSSGLARLSIDISRFKPSSAFKKSEMAWYWRRRNTCCRNLSVGGISVCIYGTSCNAQDAYISQLDRPNKVSQEVSTTPQMVDQSLNRAYQQYLCLIRGWFFHVHQVWEAIPKLSTSSATKRCQSSLQELSCPRSLTLPRWKAQIHLFSLLLCLEIQRQTLSKSGKLMSIWIHQEVPPQSELFWFFTVHIYSYSLLRYIQLKKLPYFWQKLLPGIFPGSL